MNIKEIEPTTQYINETIFEEDLNIVIDVLVDLYFKEINEGIGESVRKKHFIDRINIYKLNLQEISNWLLINQKKSSNSIYLLGYFNYNGIGTNVNKQKAIKYYQEAVKLENIIAQFDLAHIYIHENFEINYHEAFELLKKLAEREYPGGINELGHCYENGIGVDIDFQKAFELRQKAADLGNSQGINDLGWCYENGFGIVANMQKAFELYQKATDLGNSYGMYNLGYCYEHGIETVTNIQKAFDLYQKASHLGNDIAQYNLALMYEFKKDTDQAIYWYKTSAKHGNKSAKDKLKELSIKY